MAVFRLRDGEDEPVDAPSWFVDFVRLGMLAAGWCQAETTTRRIVAITAPTEDIAAAAIGFGFVRSSYLAGSVTDALKPVELEQLSPQQRIWLRAGPSARTARFIGMADRGVVRTSNGSFIRDKIAEVRALPDWFPESESRADLGDVNTEFLTQMLRSQDTERFVTSWSTRVVMIGSTARLSQELDLEIAPAHENAAFGKVREIVRPLDPCLPIGCQSVVSSSHSQDQPWHTWTSPPAMTILRGAYATSRWLPEVASACTVSILGRAEAGLDGAVAALMQARAYGDPLPKASLAWQPPNACEVLAYEEQA